MAVTKVTYIESHGAEYIDLGINFNSSTDKIEIIFQPTTSPNDELIGGGNYQSAAGEFYFGDGGHNGEMIALFGQNGAFSTGTTPVDTSKFQTFRYEDNKAYVDGVLIATNTLTINTEYNLILFGLNRISPMGFGKFKVRSVKVWRNGSLFKDFVAAKDDNSVFGLLEELSGTFLYAAAGILTGGGPMGTILTNLLDRNMFSVSGAVVSSDIYEYPATVFCMITQSLPTPIAGHKYYGRVDQKVPAGTTFGDGRFEYFGGDGTGKNIVFASFMSATMDNEWHTYSKIQSFPYISGENWTLRSFTVSGSNTVYRRKHMIIDLTEAFGAGNEPSKDWCDKNIPYFEGTIDINSAASGYVGIGGTAKKLATGYVGVNGVARKIIAGYVGVNDVARNIWAVKYATFKKYSITSEWESYASASLTGKNIFGNPDFLYVVGQPYFQKYSDTAPAFDFTGGITSKSLERDFGVRAWVANNDSVRSAPSTGFYGHFAFVSNAFRNAFNTNWVYDATIYSIRKKADVRGTYLETITAPEGRYPVNGIKDGYWWIREGGEHFDTGKALNKGSLIDLPDWSTIEYLDVPAGCTNITIETGMALGNHDCLCEYDANRNYLSYWGAGANPRTFTFDYPEQIKFIRATFLTSAIDNCYIYDNTNGQYIWKGKNV